MKGFGFRLLLFVLFAFSWTLAAVAADEADLALNAKTERYIRFVYDRIQFPKNNKLKFEVFHAGFFGYLNLIDAGKINSGSTLTICDFTISANTKRLWVIDIKEKRVLFNTLVAHGMGTGEEFAETFSNVEESHQSSLGFYTTADTYCGDNGYSLKLNGVDGRFNDKAYDRAIVMHGAEYVSYEFAAANHRIGRSYGCPALPVDLAPKIIERIQEKQCLFIFFSDKQYLRSSYWLNHPIRHLPAEADFMDLLPPVANHDIQNIKKDDLQKITTKNSVQITPQVVETCEEDKPHKVTSIILIKENLRGGMDTVIVR